jgi:KUP system potassium uptake protein
METTIQFAGSSTPVNKSSGSQTAGGVYPLRSRSRSRGRKSSYDLQKLNVVENAEDEDAGLRDERDYKQKQVRPLCRQTFWTTLTPIRSSTSGRCSSLRILR